jgi:putative tryptophan/tyrosine transport system substrate-binding protein
MTSRRRFVQIGMVAALAPLNAIAQSGKVKVGILSPRPLSSSYLTPTLVRRLAELGYRQGEGAILEYRSADDDVGRFPSLARELIAGKCDIIFAVGPYQAVNALREARTSIPVVFYANEYDPVAKGIVKTLSRPEANFTGVYVSQDALVAKRLQLMRETIPSVRHFFTLADAFSHEQLGVARKAAAAVNARLTAVEFKAPPYDFAAAFEVGRKAKVDAFLMLSSPAFATQFDSCLVHIEKNRLPGIGSAVFSEKGLLLGYGPHPTRGVRRVAELGAKILKGAKPAEIPVEQDDDFELIVNARAAKALGVKLPESIRARAIRVVS